MSPMPRKPHPDFQFSSIVIQKFLIGPIRSILIPFKKIIIFQNRKWFEQ